MDGTLANVTMFGGNFAPKGWALCNGALLSINTNTALFALIGTTYGGNGQTTFALPDLQGRMIMGTGTGPGIIGTYDLGEAAGSETNTMTTLQMPVHNHTCTVSIQAPVNNSAAGAELPGGAYYAVSANSMYNPAAGNNQNAGALSISANLQPAGSSQPIPNMMPFTAVNYIICTQGIFPSRN